jgi:hypothetical protein
VLWTSKDFFSLAAAKAIEQMGSSNDVTTTRPVVTNDTNTLHGNDHQSSSSSELTSTNTIEDRVQQLIEDVAQLYADSRLSERFWSHWKVAAAAAQDLTKHPHITNDVLRVCFQHARFPFLTLHYASIRRHKSCI